MVTAQRAVFAGHPVSALPPVVVAVLAAHGLVNRRPVKSVVNYESGEFACLPPSLGEAPTLLQTLGHGPRAAPVIAVHNPPILGISRSYVKMHSAHLLNVPSVKRENAFPLPSRDSRPQGLRPGDSLQRDPRA